MRELIDKKATIKALMAEYRECSRDGEEMGGEAILPADGIDCAIDIVRRQPPVSATVPEMLGHPTGPEKRGKWIGEEVDLEHSTMRECSVCHHIRPVDNYCSNCGARMMSGGEKRDIRLIDANALIENCSWDADTRVGYVQVVDVGDIEDAPTIDPVKHGKWVKNGDKDIIVYCDQCLMPQDTYLNYCPSCGARMDADE